MKIFFNNIMKSFGESMDSNGIARLSLHNSLLDTNIDFEESHNTNPNPKNPKIVISK